MAMGPMGGRGMRPAEKSKRGLRGVQRELFSYSERIKLPMLIALVLAAAGAVLTILGPNQLSKITNLISDSLMGEIDLAAIGRVAGVLLGIYALSAMLTYIEHYIMATVTLGLSKQMRRDLCAKINRVPMSCFNRIAHGDILSRVTNDVSTLQQALSNSLPSMISAVAQLTGCVIMMFVTEWRMALAAIAATMIGFVFMFIIMKRSQKYFVDRQESLGTLNGYIEEMYSGHDVVRISRANDKIKETFRGMNRAVYEANRKSQFLSGIMQPLMNVIGNLGYVAVCVLGAALVMNGSIKFGVITAFILYVRLFTSPLTTIAQGMTQLQSAAAAGDRVFDFLQEPELPDESKNLPVPQPVRGEIEFDHVRFSYPDHPEKTIIHDFSAHVAPGQKVAIVGPTGAGKTTMVNLLMRFYDLDGGDIRIDGISTKDMSREEVHGLFGINVKGIAIDFGGNFYALAQKEPMTIISPEQKAAREKARKVAEAKAAKERAAKAAEASYVASHPEAKSKPTGDVIKPSGSDDLDARLAGVDPEKVARVKAAIAAKAKKEAAAKQAAADEKIANLDPEKAAKVKAALEAKAAREAAKTETEKEGE